MKKSIILKSFLVMLVCIICLSIVSPVLAATDEGFEDLLGDGNNTSTNNTSNTNTGNTNTNKTNTNNTNTNKNNTNVQNINSIKNATNNTNNSKNLPKTGLQDSLPTVVLLVVFTISAVYAYHKIKEYKNID